MDFLIFFIPPIVLVLITCLIDISYLKQDVRDLQKEIFSLKSSFYTKDR